MNPLRWLFEARIPAAAIAAEAESGFAKLQVAR
jgi:hypothetical protein